jgi:hypothetical protein
MEGAYQVHGGRALRAARHPGPQIDDVSLLAAALAVARADVGRQVDAEALAAVEGAGAAAPPALATPSATAF